MEFCKATLTSESADEILLKCYLFVKMLENEIWKFGRNLPLATFGSERVKEYKYRLNRGLT